MKRNLEASSTEEGGFKVLKQSKLNFAKKPTTEEFQKEVPKAEVPSTPSTSILPIDKVHNSWLPCFKKEQSKLYYKRITGYIEDELKKGSTVYPEMGNVFSWASLCAVNQIKVVILGQDPYHDVGQAHGLAFSVKKGIVPPPSLRNIWKELETDLQVKKPGHGCLEGWAKQGVLLLNTSLTVQAHKAASHAGIGWDQFTDAIIEYVSQQTRSTVFLLWGAHAQKRAPKIAKEGNHLILQSVHPSPLSAHRGFFGCKHFSKANEYLQQNGRDPIDWSRSE